MSGRLWRTEIEGNLPGWRSLGLRSVAIALGNFVQKLFGRRMQDRGTLQNLARVLTGVRQHRSDQEKETQEKAKRLEESEAHRKALADIVKAHPKGGQIGAGGAKLPGPKGR